MLRCCDAGANITAEHSRRFRADHPVAGLWALSSALGGLGSLLNTFVLHMFVLERQALVSSVNAMIWSDIAIRC